MLSATLRRTWLAWQEEHRLLKTPLEQLLDEARPVSLHTELLVGDVTWERLSKALDQGASINERDHDGKTVLFKLAHRSDLVHHLLEHGADPNLADRTGQTPLMEACEYQRPEAVSLLLKAGANPNALVWANLPMLRAKLIKENAIPVFQEGPLDHVLLALATLTSWPPTAPPSTVPCESIQVGDPWLGWESPVVLDDGRSLPAFTQAPWYIPGTYLDHPAYPWLVDALQSEHLTPYSPLYQGLSLPSIANLLLDAGADPHLLRTFEQRGTKQNVLHRLADECSIDGPEPVALAQRLHRAGVSVTDLDRAGLIPWEGLSSPTALRRFLQVTAEESLLTAAAQNARDDEPKPTTVPVPSTRPRL